MSVSVAWRTPHRVDWGAEYDVAFDIRPKQDIANCSVQAYENGNGIPPLPHFIGSVSATRGQFVLVERMKKDWKFYTTIVGWPFKETRKKFGYYVSGSASANGQTIGFKDPDKGTYRVTIAVPKEKKREGHVAFSAFLLSVVETMISAHFPNSITPLMAEGHLTLSNLCFDAMKDPPAFDPRYDQIAKFRPVTASSLGLGEGESAQSAGKLTIELANFNAAVYGFYATERRVHSAYHDKNSVVQVWQMANLRAFNEIVNEGIERVAKMQFQTAAEADDLEWNRSLRKGNALSRVIDPHASVLLESTDSHEKARILSALGKQLRSRESYQEVAILFLQDFYRLREAFSRRTRSADALTRLVAARPIHVPLAEPIQAPLAEMREVAAGPRTVARRSLALLGEGETIICPSKPEGVEFLLRNNAWGFVSIRRQPQYFALYVSWPESSVTHFGIVDHVVDAASEESPVSPPEGYDEHMRRRKVIVLKGGSLRLLADPLPKGKMWPRRSEYVTLARLASADTYDDLRKRPHG